MADKRQSVGKVPIGHSYSSCYNTKAMSKHVVSVMFNEDPFLSLSGGEKIINNWDNDLKLHREVCQPCAVQNPKKIWLDRAVSLIFRVKLLKISQDQTVQDLVQ